MEKRGVIKKFCISFVWIISLILFCSLIYADNSSVNQTNSPESDAATIENQSKVERAFSCLSNELKTDCSGAKNVQELAFSILASPENITGSCVNQLLKKNKSEGCFGDNNNCGIKETAWAILALDHVGKDATPAITWLKKQNKTSSDVEWFLQQDSIGDVNCKLTYGGADYLFSAKENKKLSGNVGNCFSFAQSNYWLRLDENCFDEEFVLSCDKEFFAGWHYKSLGSSILNVLSETARTAATKEVKLKVASKCFGSGSTCNFEDTAWATLALKKQFEDIKPYIPYLISAEDSNLLYLPAALDYIILEYSTLYGTKLIQQQKSGTYWEAENSAYGQMYDTALALLAIGSQNKEEIISAKNWVWNFKQEANGCWNSRNVRDTAFLLWAIEQRPAQTDGEIIITPKTSCNEGGYFCSGQLDCTSVGGEILPNYACNGLKFCCSKNPVKSCSELSGKICTGGLTCSSTYASNSQEENCCLSECIEPSPKLTECEELQYSCRNSCLASQEEVDYSCGSSSVCCATKTESPQGIPFWVWLLMGIVILLIVLAIIFRDRIKVWYYKRTKGSQNNSTTQRPPVGPAGPPRPGFPPLIRPMGRPMMPPQRRPFQRPPLRPGMNPQSQNTFDKLKQMSR